MALIKSAEEIMRSAGPVRRAPRLGNKGGRPPEGRTCEKVEGCTRKHWGHGFCKSHGRRWLKWGDPLHEGRGKPPKCVCVRCPVHNPDNVAFKDN